EGPTPADLRPRLQVALHIHRRTRICIPQKGCAQPGCLAGCGGPKKIEAHPCECFSRSLLQGPRRSPRGSPQRRPPLVQAHHEAWQSSESISSPRGILKLNLALTDNSDAAGG